MLLFGPFQYICLNFLKITLAFLLTICLATNLGLPFAQFRCCRHRRKYSSPGSFVSRLRRIGQRFIAACSQKIKGSPLVDDIARVRWGYLDPPARRMFAAHVEHATQALACVAVDAELIMFICPPRCRFMIAGS